MFEINITAYTKDTGHDIWSLDTDAGEYALVTSLLLAPEVGLTDEYLLHKILHSTWQVTGYVVNFWLNDHITR